MLFNILDSNGESIEHYCAASFPNEVSGSGEMVFREHTFELGAQLNSVNGINSGADMNTDEISDINPYSLLLNPSPENFSDDFNSALALLSGVNSNSEMLRNSDSSIDSNLSSNSENSVHDMNFNGYSHGINSYSQILVNSTSLGFDYSAADVGNGTELNLHNVHNHQDDDSIGSNTLGPYSVGVLNTSVSESIENEALHDFRPANGASSATSETTDSRETIDSYNNAFTAAIATNNNSDVIGQYSVVLELANEIVSESESTNLHAQLENMRTNGSIRTPVADSLNNHMISAYDHIELDNLSLLSFEIDQSDAESVAGDSSVISSSVAYEFGYSSAYSDEGFNDYANLANNEDNNVTNDAIEHNLSDTENNNGSYDDDRDSCGDNGVSYPITSLGLNSAGREIKFDADSHGMGEEFADNKDSASLRSIFWNTNSNASACALRSSRNRNAGDADSPSSQSLDDISSSFSFNNDLLTGQQQRTAETTAVHEEDPSDDEAIGDQVDYNDNKDANTRNLINYQSIACEQDINGYSSKVC